ncbi:uncharacterized protein LOC144439823 [Glandiceps talaboti]
MATAMDTDTIPDISLSTTKQDVETKDSELANANLENTSEPGQSAEGKTSTLPFGDVRDFRIRQEGVIFAVDKETLVNRFEYFEILFSSSFMEKEKSEIEMRKVPTASAMFILLNLVYEGRFDVNPGNIVEVLEAADFLKVRVPTMVTLMHAFYLNLSLDNWIRYFRLVENYDFNLKSNLKFVINRWMKDNVTLIKEAAQDEGIQLNVVRDETPKREVPMPASSSDSDRMPSDDDDGYELPLHDIPHIPFLNYTLSKLGFFGPCRTTPLPGVPFLHPVADPLSPFNFPSIQRELDRADALRRAAKEKEAAERDGSDDEPDEQADTTLEVKVTNAPPKSKSFPVNKGRNQPPPHPPPKNVNDHSKQKIQQPNCKRA